MQQLVLQRLGLIMGLNLRDGVEMARAHISKKTNEAVHAQMRKGSVLPWLRNARTAGLKL